MSTPRAFLIVAAAGAALLVPQPASAAPTSVPATCGAVIKTNAYLKADLTCPGDGVTLVGAVTLDLREHRLMTPDGVAVRVAPHELAPRIRHGRIEESATGIATDVMDEEFGTTTRTVTVDGVSFNRNGDAINASDTSPGFSTFGRTNFTITRSHFDHNGSGISGLFTSLFTVSRSSFTDNGQALRFDTGNVAVDRSRIEGNDSALSCVEAGCTVTNSRLKDNVAGIALIDGSGDLTKNVITGSKVAYFARGVFQPQLSLNTFKYNATAVDLGLTDATLTRNRFIKNGLAFTASNTESTQATLVRNLFQGNQDGISTTEPGVRLQANTASYNKHYGIYAPQATDLGGNRARRNGYSPQCTGVVC